MIGQRLGFLVSLLFLAGAGVGTAPARAETAVSPELEARVESAMHLIDQIIEKVAQIGKRERVEEAFKQAHGFAVFVDVRQVGVMVSKLSGHGVLAFRDRDGEWNPPVLLHVEGNSFGPHMRAQSGDTLVLLKTPGAVQRFLSGAGTELKHGTEVAGPAQEVAVADAEMVAYTINRGLAGGIAVEKVRVSVDQEANTALYGIPVEAGDILRGQQLRLKRPPCAQKFVETTNRVAGKPSITRYWQ